jgi:hypothetical protein
MQDREFMADFTRAMKGAMTASELRAKYKLSTDALRSVIDAVAAERDGTPERAPKRARKKPGPPAKHLDAKEGLIRHRPLEVGLALLLLGVAPLAGLDRGADLVVGYDGGGGGEG